MHFFVKTIGTLVSVRMGTSSFLLRIMFPLLCVVIILAYGLFSLVWDAVRGNSFPGRFQFL